jgi:hypothetical protein
MGAQPRLPRRSEDYLYSYSYFILIFILIRILTTIVIVIIVVIIVVITIIIIKSYWGELNPSLACREGPKIIFISFFLLLFLLLLFCFVKLTRGL